MNTLLIFFALPIAVIIISIALQKIFRCPILVAAIIFAIFLILTFALNNLNILVLAIAYAILSFITAYITYIICRILNLQCNCNRNINNSATNNGLMAINQISNNLIQEQNQNQNNNCGCTNNCMNNCQNDNNNDNQVSGGNGITARINIIPTTNNNNTGTINGCYRRR